MANPVALPGLNDANPVRQNTAIRQISERLEADYAPLASPVFTGDPQAPTPALADNDTSIATTAYVQGQNYTTKSYVDGANATQDTAIAGKAPTVHTHAQSDVTGLVTALAGKEPTITAGTTSQYYRGDKTFQTFPTQRVVSYVRDTYAAITQLTATMSATDTVPTTSQGTQILSRSVTTTTATQLVELAFSGFGTASSGQVIIAAIFRGTTCVGSNYLDGSPGTQPIGMGFSVVDAPGAAGTYTYTVRVGQNNASFYLVMNGQGATRYGGGSALTTLITQVIEP